MPTVYIRAVDAAIKQQFSLYCRARGINQAKIFTKAFLAYQKAHPDP